MNHLAITTQILDLLVPLTDADRTRVLRSVQAVVDMTVDEGGFTESVVGSFRDGSVIVKPGPITVPLEAPAARPTAPPRGDAPPPVGPQQVRVHPLDRAQGPVGRGEALRVGDNGESVLRRGEPVIASRGGRRIGLYPSLDEALDRRHRDVLIVGTELHRIRDGVLLARFVEAKKLEGIPL